MKQNPEVDELISLMRQSRMDSIREYLEDQVKQRNKGSKNSERFLIWIKAMFTETSTVKPK